MPQIAPRGKYVFGWCRVHTDGVVSLPPETIAEYRFCPRDELVLTLGSRTSGGFSVGKWALLQASELAEFITRQDAAGDSHEAAEPTPFGARWYVRCTLDDDGTLRIPLPTLAAFGVHPGDDLLAIRGSYLAVILIQRGPLVTHAQQHPEIEHFA